MKTGMRNYHTHTSRCKHASGTDEEYVLTAIEQGYAALGFTDHTPWPYANGYVSRIRMDVEQLGDYVASIRALKEKYRGRIELFIGLECEPFPQYYGWLREMKEKYQLDYLILGNSHPGNSLFRSLRVACDLPGFPEGCHYCYRPEFHFPKASNPFFADASQSTPEATTRL